MSVKMNPTTVMSMEAGKERSRWQKEPQKTSTSLLQVWVQIAMQTRWYRAHHQLVIWAAQYMNLQDPQVNVSSDTTSKNILQKSGSELLASNTMTMMLLNLGQNCERKADSTV